jgi:hypothetical protein
MKAAAAQLLQLKTQQPWQRQMKPHPQLQSPHLQQQQMFLQAP